MKVNDISEPSALGNYITVFQLTSIQNNKASDENREKVLAEAKNYDENGAQSVLLASKKVENNVADVYFNKIMSR